jgi:hypothetical protein
VPRLEYEEREDHRSRAESITRLGSQIGT